MNASSGIIGKVVDWINHPANSDGDIMDWTAGLLVVIILSFLWSTVIRQLIK
jgi:hypothetical protein